MASENRVGEVLASKYRLEELLGSGGMGHVYRAVNEHIGRAVAIKVLRKEHAENSQVVERFLREARAANLVRHPNVVDVLDVGKEDGGSPFIVQELLDGEDLAHLVTRRGGKLPIEEVCAILLPVIAAVAEAHHRGVVHRDIKPENVFLAKSPHGPIPKLLDFGISKVRSSDLRATEVGMMMGTPAYMAPEQIQGSRDADPRSDVWALGVMMFEVIAGRMPFDAQDAPQLFIAIATQDAPTLLEVRADVTPAISQVVARCLRRQPSERYPSAAELGRDLQHVVDGTELEATGKRSIPPALLAVVPELGIPSASSVKGVAVSPPQDLATDTSPDGQALVDAKAATSPGLPGVPEAPSLPPPPPRSQASSPARAAPPAPAAPSPPAAAPAATASAPPRSQASPPSRPAAPESQGSRLAVGASLPGVMMAPGASSMKRAGSHASWGVTPREPQAAGLSTIIGLAVVGLVGILGAGLLMQLVHRQDGWALARFLGLPQGTVLPIQLALGLVALAIGTVYCRRGVRHWRGELAGGRGGAILNGVVAAAAFFSAIELFTAMS